MPYPSGRIALIGATGLVGRTVLKVLRERGFPSDRIIAFATNRGEAERTVTIGDIIVKVHPLPDRPPHVKYALFCAPNEVAHTVIPLWKSEGIRVIDNSSAFRMDTKVPLVVPEVNPEAIQHAENLVANPNCSTIQLAVALAPLHQKWGINRVSVTTFQAVSGAGSSGILQLRAEQIGGRTKSNPFPRQIRSNVIPAIGEISENGFCGEELKMMQELPKILSAPDLPAAVTTVRVPVETGHSEAVECSLDAAPSLDEVISALKSGSGIVFMEEVTGFHTPIEIAGNDEVFVSRLRIHPTDNKTLLMWVVADNLRKGAATNAIQILERWEELNP